MTPDKVRHKANPWWRLSDFLLNVVGIATLVLSTLLLVLQSPTVQREIIDFALRTAEEALEVRIEVARSGYNILGLGASFGDLRVSDKSGQPLLTAKGLRLSLPLGSLWSKPAVRLRLTHPEIWVEQRPNGTWNLPFMGDAPVVAEFEEAPEEPLNLPHLLVESLAIDDLQIHYRQEGIELTTRNTEFEGRIELPELTGRLKLMLPAVEMKMEEQTFRLEPTKLEAKFTEGRGSIRLDTGFGGIGLTADGQVESILDLRSLELRASLLLEGASALAKRLSMPLAGKVTLKAKGTGSWRSMELAARVSFHLLLDEKPLPNLLFFAKTQTSQPRADLGLELQTKNLGQARVEARVEWEKGHWEATGELRELDLSELARAFSELPLLPAFIPLNGRIEAKGIGGDIGTLQASGKISTGAEIQPELLAALLGREAVSPDGKVMDKPASQSAEQEEVAADLPQLEPRAVLAFALERGRLEIRELRVSESAAAVVVSGKVMPDLSVNLDFSGKIQDLGRYGAIFGQEMAGKLDFSGRLSGGAEDPGVQLEATLREAMVSGAPLELAATLALADGILTSKKLEIAAADCRVAADIRLGVRELLLGVTRGAGRINLDSMECGGTRLGGGEIIYELAPDQLSVTASLLDGDLAGNAALDLPPTLATAEVAGRLDLESYRELLGLQPEQELSGRLELQGSARYLFPSAEEPDGSLDANGEIKKFWARTGGLDIGLASPARLDFSPDGRILLRKTTLAIEESPLSGDGPKPSEPKRKAPVDMPSFADADRLWLSAVFQPENAAVEARLSGGLRLRQLRAFLDFPELSGLAKVEIAVSGNLEAPEIQGTAEILDLVPGPLEAGSIQMKIPLVPRGTAKLELALFPQSPTAESGLLGKISASLDIKGLQLEGQPFGDSMVSAFMDPKTGGLGATGIFLDNQVRGSLFITDGTLDAKLEAENLDLGPLLLAGGFPKEGTDGQMGFDIAVAVPLSAPEKLTGRLHLRSWSCRIAGLPLDLELASDIEIQPGPRILLEGLDLVMGDPEAHLTADRGQSETPSGSAGAKGRAGRFHLLGDVDLGRGTSNLSFASSLDLAKLRPLAISDLSGSLGSEILVTGPLEAPILEGYLSISGFAGGGFEADKISLEFIPRAEGPEKSAIFDATLQVLGLSSSGYAMGDTFARASVAEDGFEIRGRALNDQVELFMEWPFDEASRAKLTFQTRSLVLDPFLEMADLETAHPPKGFFSSKGTFFLPVAEPMALDGWVDLEHLEMKFDALTVALKRKSRVELKEGIALLQDLRLETENSFFTVAGTAGAETLDLRTQGEFQLREIQPFLASMAAISGEITWEIALTGPPTAPRLDGRVRMEKIAATTAEPEVTLKNLRGTLEARGTHIRLEAIKAELGKGLVTVSGSIGLDDPFNPTANIGMNLNDARIEIDEYDADLLLDGDLEYRGPLLAGNLTGELELLDLRYAPDLNPLEILSSLTSKVRTVTPYTIQLEDLPLHAVDQTLEAEPELNLTLVARAGSIVVDSSLAGATAEAELQITGTPTSPGILGAVKITSGFIDFYKAKFDNLRGSILFEGDPFALDPSLNLQGETEKDGELIILAILGKASGPQLDLQSSSNKSQADIVLLLTRSQSGKSKSPEEILKGAAISQASSFASSKLSSATGLDVRLVPPPQNGKSLLLSIGKQISDALAFTFYMTERPEDPDIYEVKFQASEAVSLEAQRSDSTTLRLRYRKKFD